MPDDTAQAAETAALPPLTEAMTVTSVNAHVMALTKQLPPLSDVMCGFEPDGFRITLYPGGIGARDYERNKGRVVAATFPEAFALARVWIATHATVHRDNRIRAMALAIIDVTDQFGRCDRAMLTRRDFRGAEVDALKDAACVMASEMSANSPFSVEG